MRDLFRIASLFAFNSCLGIFLTYGVFFNKISIEFHQVAFSTSIVFGFFAVSYSISSFLLGGFMAKYGAKKTILFGGLLMALGFFLSALANSIPFLIATYGLIAGLGSGSMWLSTSYAVFENFPAEKIRSVTGIVSAGTAFGSLFFAPLEASIIYYYGWRIAFIILSVLVLIFAFSAALSSSNKSGYTNTNSTGLLTREVFSRIGKDTRFWYLYCYYMLGNAFSRTIAMVFVVPMLEFRGFSLVVSSLSPALIGAGSIFGRFSTNIRALSEETISSLSFIIQGLSSVGLFYSTNIFAIYILSFVFGLGYGGYIPQFALITRKVYGIKNYSAVFGFLLSSFGIGALLASLFGGYNLVSSGGYETIFYASSLTSLVIGIHQLFTRKRFRLEQNSL